MNSTAHADKFVVRLPEGMRDAVAERASEAFISMNSFVVQSVAEKLDREQRAKRAIDALEYTAQIMCTIRDSDEFDPVGLDSEGGSHD